MAQIKVLKINSFGTPEENAAADDVTFGSYTVNGGGPVLSAAGLDMNNTDVSDVQDLVFTDPSTGTINQTAGDLIVDNLMAKERDNVMTTAGAILFPSITDAAGQVDSFKIPHLAGPPTATPAFSTDAGYLVYDDTNDNLYIWSGTAWDNLNTVTSAQNLDNLFTAEATIAARDLVYISSADNVSPALADTQAHAQGIGFAVAGAAAAGAVSIRSEGVVTGFTGLTAGSRYFLSGTTPGAITATVPTTTGHTVLSAGYAKSTTALHIQFQNMGKRA